MEQSGQNCVPSFACGMCGKCFTEADHCRLHIQSHTGSKSFPCIVCWPLFYDMPGSGYTSLQPVAGASSAPCTPFIQSGPSQPLSTPSFDLSAPFQGVAMEAKTAPETNDSRINILMSTSGVSNVTSGNRSVDEAKPHFSSVPVVEQGNNNMPIFGLPDNAHGLPATVSVEPSPLLAYTTSESTTAPSLTEAVTVSSELGNPESDFLLSCPINVDSLTTPVSASVKASSLKKGGRRVKTKPKRLAPRLLMKAAKAQEAVLSDHMCSSVYTDHPVCSGGAVADCTSLDTSDGQQDCTGVLNNTDQEDLQHFLDDAMSREGTMSVDKRLMVKSATVHGEEPSKESPVNFDKTIKLLKKIQFQTYAADLCVYNPLKNNRTFLQSQRTASPNSANNTNLTERIQEYELVRKVKRKCVHNQSSSDSSDLGEKVKETKNLKRTSKPQRSNTNSIIETGKDKTTVLRQNSEEEAYCLTPFFDKENISNASSPPAIAVLASVAAYASPVKTYNVQNSEVNAGLNADQNAFCVDHFLEYPLSDSDTLSENNVCLPVDLVNRSSFDPRDGNIFSAIEPRCVDDATKPAVTPACAVGDTSTQQAGENNCTVLQSKEDVSLRKKASISNAILVNTCEKNCRVLQSEEDVFLRKKASISNAVLVTTRKTDGLLNDEDILSKTLSELTVTLSSAVNKSTPHVEQIMLTGEVIAGPHKSVEETGALDKSAALTKVGEGSSLPFQAVLKPPFKVTPSQTILKRAYVYLERIDTELQKKETIRHVNVAPSPNSVNSINMFKVPFSCQGNSHEKLSKRNCSGDGDVQFDTEKMYVSDSDATVLFGDENDGDDVVLDSALKTRGCTQVIKDSLVFIEKGSIRHSTVSPKKGLDTHRMDKPIDQSLTSHVNQMSNSESEPSYENQKAAVIKINMKYKSDQQQKRPDVRSRSCIPLVCKRKKHFKSLVNQWDIDSNSTTITLNSRSGLVDLKSNSALNHPVGLEIPAHGIDQGICPSSDFFPQQQSPQIRNKEKKSFADKRVSGFKQGPGRPRKISQNIKNMPAEDKSTDSNMSDEIKNTNVGAERLMVFCPENKFNLQEVITPGQKLRNSTLSTDNSASRKSGNSRCSETPEVLVQKNTTSVGDVTSSAHANMTCDNEGETNCSKSDVLVQQQRPQTSIPENRYFSNQCVSGVKRRRGRSRKRSQSIEYLLAQSKLKNKIKRKPRVSAEKLIVLFPESELNLQEVFTPGHKLRKKSAVSSDDSFSKGSESRKRSDTLGDAPYSAPVNITCDNEGQPICTSDLPVQQQRPQTRNLENRSISNQCVKQRRGRAKKQTQNTENLPAQDKSTDSIVSNPLIQKRTRKHCVGAEQLIVAFPETKLTLQSLFTPGHKLTTTSSGPPDKSSSKESGKWTIASSTKHASRRCSSSLSYKGHEQSAKPCIKNKVVLFSTSVTSKHKEIGCETYGQVTQIFVPKIAESIKQAEQKLSSSIPSTDLETELAQTVQNISQVSKSPLSDCSRPPKLNQKKEKMLTHPSLNITSFDGNLKKYECQKCHAKFQKHIKLLRHKHNKCQDRYYCDVCGNSFGRKESLNIHKRLHTGESAVECQVCGRQLRSVGSLKSHMLIHTNEKPYKCSMCKKQFRQQPALAAHFRTHTGLRPFNCDLCHKSYRHHKNLYNHKFTHTGEKHHICPVCNKAFNQVGNLHNHMKSQHDNIRPVICEFCDKRFVLNRQLLNHKKVVHFDQTRTIVESKESCAF